MDGDETLHANRVGFANYSLRVRRLVDLSKIDVSANLFGTTWETSIFLDPVGSQRAFHAEGELAVARAAKSKKHLQVLSTVASTSVEDVTGARGAPIWYQLYPTDHWPITQALARRAEAAGCHPGRGSGTRLGKPHCRRRCTYGVPGRRTARPLGFSMHGAAMPLVKLIVVLLLVAIVVNLGSALYHLARDTSDSKQMLRALTWRISLSVILFVLLLLAYQVGWIAPHVGN